MSRIASVIANSLSIDEANELKKIFRDRKLPSQRPGQIQMLQRLRLVETFNSGIRGFVTPLGFEVLECLLQLRNKPNSLCDCFQFKSQI